MFIGVLPWLGVVLIPFILFFKKIEPSKKQFIAFLTLSLFLSFIFCLNINSFTLYRYVFDFPGFSAMRAINRVINTEVLFFVFVFVFVFNELAKRNKIVNLVTLCFPILIIIDNLINPIEVTRFNKSESQKMVEAVKQPILSQYNNKRYKAIAYMAENISEDPIKIQLNIMLAAQDLSIPCVNAYSGDFPPNYDDFFRRTDEPSLLRWLNYNHTNKDGLQTINELNKKEEGRRIVSLRAANNKFICDGDTVSRVLLADRDTAGDWETFTLILFKDNHCAIRSHTGFFVSAEIWDETEVVADRKTIGSWETFTIEKLADDYMAFKTANNKYLSLDRKFPKLYAKGKNIGINERFKVIDK